MRSAGSGHTLTCLVAGSTRTMAFWPPSVNQGAPSGPTITPCGADFLPSEIRSISPLAGFSRPAMPGNPGGSPEATRRLVNKAFLEALAEDFRQGGAEAIAKVRKHQPAAYMKICALLVPREMKLEHSGGVKAMTTEEIECGIEIIKEMIAKRNAAANATGGEGEAVPSLPPPVSAKNS